MSITVEHLTKSYKIKNRSVINNTVKHLVIPQYSFTPAVNDISFTIQTGDIVGFIGANGAGKSTTIKMLTGILDIEDGEIIINNHCIRKYTNLTDLIYKDNSLIKINMIQSYY